MIYALIVLYNLNMNKNQINEIRKNNIIPIIFDNSIENSVLRINKCLADDLNIIYYALNRNIGLAKAYNFVIKKHIKKDDWLVILDQDTEIPNHFFNEIINITNKPDRISYLTIFEYSKNKFCPKIIKNPEKCKVICQFERKDLDGFLLGINTCSLFSGLLFDKVGLFNENLFLDYIDLDFCLRIALKEIKSKTINIEIKQHFFSKEPSTLIKVKRRLSIQKHDAKVFYSSPYLKGFFRKKYCYLRDILKYIFLYCLTNKMFWFIPLLFVRAKTKFD